MANKGNPHHRGKRRRNAIDKAQSQQMHFFRRAGQRVDGLVTQRDADRIIAEIQSGTAKFVERQSLRISVFQVELQDQSVNVVYDRHRKTLVTVLYPQMDLDNDRDTSYDAAHNE